MMINYISGLVREFLITITGFKHNRFFKKQQQDCMKKNTDINNITKNI